MFDLALVTHTLKGFLGGAKLRGHPFLFNFVFLKSEQVYSMGSCV